MIDVIYPLSNRSQWQDSEIRYSLRSLCKYVPHDKVYIIGHKPEFLTNVIHIPFKDSYAVNKDANLIAKVLRACYEDVSDEFIRMADDYYFLQPYEKAYYYFGDLKISLNDKYGKTIFETRDLLRTEKKPILNYDVHCPQVVNKNQYVDIMLQAPFAQGNNGLLVNSYYFNSLFPGKTEHHKQLETGIFLNHGDKVEEKVKEKLAALFPEKCKYEI